MGALFLVVTVLLPSEIAGWGGAGERLLPFAAVLLVVAAPTDVLAAPARTVVVGSLATFAIASAWWTHRFERQVLMEGARFLDAVPSLEPRPGHWYGITTSGDNDARETPFPRRTSPFGRTPQIAALGLGGFVDGSHATLPGIHPLALRPGVQSTTADLPTLAGDEDRHLALVPRLLGLVAPLDGLLLFTSSPEPRLEAALARAGLVLEERAAGLSSWRLSGCPLEGHVSAQPGAILDVVIGVWPEKSPVRSSSLRVDERGSARLDVERFPCAESWIVVDGARCAEARGPLPARAPVVDGRIDLRCTIAP
jgi:hypothetical protein